MRLIQLIADGGRSVAASLDGSAEFFHVLGFRSVYDLAFEALDRGVTMEAVVRGSITESHADYYSAMQNGLVLPPLDHADPARTLVSLTGLTHLGSTQARARLHKKAVGDETDSERMFRFGVEGGKPSPGTVGAQPEWAYKGYGNCIIAPGHAITRPGYAEDGGEEAEIAGLYVIGRDGSPWRVGFAIGNEFADHVLEKRNYLYLAHSKIRECSFGPELLVGDLPAEVEGAVRVRRGAACIWEAPVLTGEAHMCHSISNLEAHHFKYSIFRRPGDVHVHFFGANRVSFADGVAIDDGDVMEIDLPAFGRPLVNTVRFAEAEPPVAVGVL